MVENKNLLIDVADKVFCIKKNQKLYFEKQLCTHSGVAAKVRKLLSVTTADAELVPLLEDV